MLPVKEIARSGRDEELYRFMLRKKKEKTKTRGRFGNDVPGSHSCWDPSWPIWGQRESNQTRPKVECHWWPTIDRSPGPVCFTWKFSSWSSTGLRRGEKALYRLRTTHGELVAVYRERSRPVAFEEITAFLSPSY